jgi:hypothetical protein
MTGNGLLGRTGKIKKSFGFGITIKVVGGFLAVIYISIELNNPRPTAIAMGLNFINRQELNTRTSIGIIAICDSLSFF